MIVSDFSSIFAVYSASDFWWDILTERSSTVSVGEGSAVASNKKNLAYVEVFHYLQAAVKNRNVRTSNYVQLLPIIYVIASRGVAEYATLWIAAYMSL